MYHYAKNNQAERFAFRRKIENEVISDMRQYIKNEYVVYKVSFKDEVELKDFVKSHFYDLAGRMFSNENRLIVAFSNENKRLINVFNETFLETMDSDKNQIADKCFCQ